MRPACRPGPRVVVASGAAADAGAALVTVLLLTLLLQAAGLGLVLVGATERLVAAHGRDAVEARYAASAMLERAVDDLTLMSDWTPAVSGLVRSGFAVGAMTMARPDGAPLDLALETAMLQETTGREIDRGTDTPEWRLFGWGPLSALTGTVVGAPARPVAAWVADDRSEADGLPSVDSNGIVIVRAASFGRGGSRYALSAALGVVIDPAGGRGVRVLSWRETR